MATVIGSRGLPPANGADRSHRCDSRCHPSTHDPVDGDAGDDTSRTLHDHIDAGACLESRPVGRLESELSGPAPYLVGRRGTYAPDLDTLAHVGAYRSIQYTGALQPESNSPVVRVQGDEVVRGTVGGWLSGDLGDTGRIAQLSRGSTAEWWSC